MQHKTKTQVSSLIATRVVFANKYALVLWIPRDVDDPEVMWQMLIDSISLSAGFGIV